MKTSIIIPAYNEEDRIANTIEVALKTPEINEIIVVDDGSDDKTYEIANSFEEVISVRLQSNKGKAAAMRAGFERSTGEIIVFKDADLIGVNPFHLKDLITAVLDGYDMGVVIFNSGSNQAVNLSQRLTWFSGQRVFRRETLDDFFRSNKKIDDMRFGIEIAIEKYIKKKELKRKVVVWQGTSQFMKEQKIGGLKGVKERTLMYKDILNTLLKD